jgi:competence protein ComEC
VSLPGAVAAHPRHVVLGAVAVGLALGGAPPAWAPAAAGVVAVGAAAVWPARPLLVLLVAAALLGGAAAGSARLAAIDRTALGPSLGRPFAAAAEVAEPARTTASGRRSVVLRLRSGPGRGERVVARLPRGHRAVPGPGALVVARGRLLRLGPFERHLGLRGVHAALDGARVVPAGGVRGGLAGHVDAVRRRAERALAAGLPRPEAALARGMLLGQDEAVPAAVREDFRRSGLLHLMAVSGQNVVLLCTLALALCAPLGVPLRFRLALALALVALYVPLTGAGPSIQRAGVMGAAGLVAALAGRPASRWYALLLAAAATLALNPRTPAEPGWQLSFAATVALLLWAPRLRERWACGPGGRGLPGPLADVAAVSVAAGMATLPLLAVRFGEISLTGLPANLLAAPLVAPIMWLGMAAAAAGQLLPALAWPFGVLQAPLLACLERLAHAAGAPAGATANVGLGPAGGVLAAVAAAALLEGLARGALWPAPLLRRARAAPGRAVAAPAFALALVVAAWPGAGDGIGRPPAGVRISFLDIGQGDATLLQHGERAVLVDTGPPDGPILRRLREAGVRRLDLLVLTHHQADHDGAALRILRELPVGLVLDGGREPGPGGVIAALPGAPPPPARPAPAAAGRDAPPWAARAPSRAETLAAARAAGVRVVPAFAGQRLRAGPIELRVLWPRAGARAADPNDLAVVAHARDGELDALLTADAESPVLTGLDLPRAELLKVPHHGSEDPGLPALLERVRPRLAAIEVGARNTYGHPTAQALAALRAVPEVRRTDRDGTVRVTVAGGALRVSTAR